MQAPTVVRHRSASSSEKLAPLAQVEIVQAGVPAAANDDQVAASAEYRPNPLWAVNVAMAVFFLTAALVLASG